MENYVKNSSHYHNDVLINDTSMGSYAHNFSDSAFFEKVRLIIPGGLGYFILPIDVIPDFIVGFGYTDDLSVLIGVLACCYVHVDDAVRTQAHAKIREWFGEEKQGFGIIDRVVTRGSMA